MVDSVIHKDLLSFGVRILVVGDPGQLPPIGKDIHLLSKPDYMLRDIVRQEKDSPIIRLSQMVLSGKDLHCGHIGSNVYICNKEDIPDRTLLAADQILCGKNDTRIDINKHLRKLMGFKDRYPYEGEKLICTKNDWSAFVDGIPIINGTIGYCKGLKRTTNGYFLLNFNPDFSYDSVVLKVDSSCFISNSPVKGDMYDYFDFGYAITVHKSQGSEFDNVVVYNEMLHPRTYKRWLYTAVTRAKKNLVILI